MLLRNVRLASKLPFLPSSRRLSSQVATATAQQLTTPTKSLSELSERAGYVPRPQEPETDPKPGFRGGRALFIFFLCNAIPFSAIMYYLREQREKRTEMAMLSLPKAPEEVAAEVLRVVRTAAVCFLLQDAEAATGNALRVDPHPPEASAYVPPSGPLPLVPQMERNFLTDLLESPAVAGLGFIHFALSRRSQEAQAILAGRRKAALLYVSHTRAAYCTITGQLSILPDPDCRRRYWKPSWSWCFTAPAADAQQEEAPEPWRSEDYVLVRFAIDQASLQSVVDTALRWDARHVKRVPGNEGPRWEDAMQI